MQIFGNVEIMKTKPIIVQAEACKILANSPEEAILEYRKAFAQNKVACNFGEHTDKSKLCDTLNELRSYKDDKPFIAYGKKEDWE